MDDIKSLVNEARRENMIKKIIIFSVLILILIAASFFVLNNKSREDVGIRYIPGEDDNAEIPRYVGLRIKTISSAESGYDVFRIHA